MRYLVFLKLYTTLGGSKISINVSGGGAVGGGP
jgi:hypothetical protein